MSDGAYRVVATTLLTGFLGGGKTSLLRRLLRRPDLADTAVLINEFGEVGLDHLLVEEARDEVLLLKSGCVCCTIRGDLRDALARLHGRMVRGEVPAFSRVVIETTGLAEPLPILATLAHEPVLRHHFRVAGVVTVIDAVNGGRNLDAFAVAVEQAAAADRIVVTKADLSSPAATDALRRRLARLNPAAAIVMAGEADAAPDLLADGARAAFVVPSHAREPHAHDEVLAASSFVVEEEAPVDWAAFGLWLSMLLHRHGALVLRVKGLVRVAGEERPSVVQGVQHLIHRPEHLDAWPDGRPATRLVFIVRGLDAEGVRRSFRAFCRPGGERGTA